MKCKNQINSRKHEAHWKWIIHSFAKSTVLCVLVSALTKIKNPQKTEITSIILLPTYQIVQAPNSTKCQEKILSISHLICRTKFMMHLLTFRIIQVFPINPQLRLEIIKVGHLFMKLITVQKNKERLSEKQ